MIQLLGAQSMMLFWDSNSQKTASLIVHLVLFLYLTWHNLPTEVMTMQIIRTIPAAMAAKILAFSDAILTLTDQKWEYLGQSSINEFQTFNAYKVYFYELHFHVDFVNCFTYLLKVILMHSLSWTWHITKNLKLIWR